MREGNGTAEKIMKRELFPEDALYGDALRLRYEVFFEPHGLAPEVVMDDLERSSRHFALLEEERLVAYARLTFIAHNEAKISQMVVVPARQGSGLGSILLAWLIELCERERIDKVVLEARAAKTGFYVRHGFLCSGKPYPSRRTGIPHVHMELVPGRSPPKPIG